jgi:hypothetical protein
MTLIMTEEKKSTHNKGIFLMTRISPADAETEANNNTKKSENANLYDFVQKNENLPS